MPPILATLELYRGIFGRYSRLGSCWEAAEMLASASSWLEPRSRSTRWCQYSLVAMSTEASRMAWSWLRLMFKHHDLSKPHQQSHTPRLSMSDDFMKSHLDAVQQVGRALPRYSDACAIGGKTLQSAGYTITHLPKSCTSRHSGLMQQQADAYGGGRSDVGFA